MTPRNVTGPGVIPSPYAAASVNLLHRIVFAAVRFAVVLAAVRLLVRLLEVRFAAFLAGALFAGFRAAMWSHLLPSPNMPIS
jgi:hypothetical protein